MARQGKTLQLTFPHLAPEKEVGNFLHSKAIDSKTILPSFDPDKVYDPIELKLVAALRQYEKSAALLAAKREYYQNAQVQFDTQWKDLREKQEQFKDNFVKFNNFIQNNESKTARATLRKQEDLRLQVERTKSIDNLEENVALIERVQSDMDEAVLRHKIYNDYLNSVISSGTEFINANHLIDRFESLCETKKLLAEKQNGMLTNLENARTKSAKMIEEYTFCILGMNNALANLNGRFRKALQKSTYWESVVWDIKQNSFAKFKEFMEVKEACKNIYRLMCLRKQKPPQIEDDNFEMQLSYIKKTLDQFGQLQSEADEQLEKHFSSLKVEVSDIS